MTGVTLDNVDLRGANLKNIHFDGYPSIESGTRFYEDDNVWALSFKYEFDIISSREEQLRLNETDFRMARSAIVLIDKNFYDDNVERGDSVHQACERATIIANNAEQLIQRFKELYNVAHSITLFGRINRGENFANRLYEDDAPGNIQSITDHARQSGLLSNRTKRIWEQVVNEAMAQAQEAQNENQAAPDEGTAQAPGYFDGEGPPGSRQ